MAMITDHVMLKAGATVTPDQPSEVKELLGYCIQQFEEAEGRKNRRLYHRDQIRDNIIQAVQLIDKILQDNNRLKDQLDQLKEIKKKSKKKKKASPRRKKK